MSSSANLGSPDTNCLKGEANSINESLASEPKSPAQLPTPITTNDDGMPAHFPSSFSSLMPGMKYYYNGESELVSELQLTLGPFGITRLTLGCGSRKS